jgi:Ser/Thr protein kinase RdoA (MazF antagonist)
MMKLSLMKKFFEAGTLNPDSPLIEGILSRWGYDRGTVSFIRASNSFIFKFSQAGRSYVLRLTHVEQVTQSGVEAELAFLKYLSENNVCVYLPLKTLAGQEIELCHTPVGSFYAVVFQYFAGKIYDIDELEERQFALWGEALGNLHRVSVSCSGIQRASCFDHLAQSKNLLREQEHVAHEELLTLTHWLETRQKTEQNYGLIHFDFELDNLIWDGDKIQIIDFDKSIFSWYVADLAFALRDLFEHDLDLTNRYFVSFIEGYRRRMEISQQDLHEIPMFLRLHNLETFLELQTAMGLEKSAFHENHQWIIDLTNKLERKVNEYRESFKQFRNYSGTLNPGAA